MLVYRQIIDISDAEKRADTFKAMIAVNVVKHIFDWKVYRFHDTSGSSPMKRAGGSVR
ncbi:hypothetical protein HVA01_06760 [Halovibrio variabilis]|uniref:Uncharacterized protein n=1 Tax=Halovibrio variabilis TaxID=31910 RepID=A0A511UKD4_9GAMM|nr:hypothetical protein HVA01_06760 [Halovibrio variabilis]